MKTSLILYDGEFHPEENLLFPSLAISSSLFSEKIRAIRNQLPFWNEHFQLIQLKFQLLNEPLPKYLQNEGRELQRQIERTLIKNKFFKSALLTIRFLKQEKKISYLISLEEINETSFTLNKAGRILQVSNKIQKAVSPLSSLSFGSEPFWKIIQSEHLPSSVTDLLLTNTLGTILEVPEKNIYLIQGTDILTPSPSTGAYVDISKKIIQKVIFDLGLNFKETEQLNQSDFLKADEVFLSNAVNGIEWVKGFFNKRYFSKTVRKISAEFNRILVQRRIFREIFPNQIFASKFADRL